VQIYITIEKVGKAFEVLAMIPKDTQIHGVEQVLPGPVLKDAEGKEHIKPEGGWFPKEVAKKGALVTLETADASMAADKVAILRKISQCTDAQTEPPSTHPGYDKVNSAVRRLFRGAAIYSHAMSGETEKVRALLSESTSEINYQSPAGTTPIYMAAQEANNDTVELLAQLKADVNTAQKDGATPIWVAAYQANNDTVQLLAQLKADVNTADEDGVTPIFIAAQNGHLNTVQALINAAADLNATLPIGSHHSPLTISALQGHLSVYELLLANGADAAYEALPWDKEPFVTEGGTATQIWQQRA
jgi:hypothetical protein